MTPLQVIQKILFDLRNPNVVQHLYAPDVKYVSLNYETSDLKKVLPWIGTHIGFQGIVETFTNVNKYWSVDKFQTQASFDDGENVAIFGRFTTTSVTLKKTMTSPFAIFAKGEDGKAVYLQFMEDTWATANTFRPRETWAFQSDPDGDVAEV